MNTQKATFMSSAWTTVGKKVLTGITGIAWILFTIAHLLGNFQLFLNDGGAAFNAYTKFLESQGVLLYIAEAGLVLTLLLHAAIGINIWLGKRRARPVGYTKYVSAGEPSAQNLSSRTMIVTGSILMIFLVAHIWTFKFGPGMAEGYVTTIDGEPARDLYKLVIETFKKHAPAPRLLECLPVVGSHQALGEENHAIRCFGGGRLARRGILEHPSLYLFLR
jgi:succinate dehydrogenase / fumarate reductase cytochrome b subunit